MAAPPRLYNAKEFPVDKLQKIWQRPTHKLHKLYSLDDMRESLLQCRCAAQGRSVPSFDVVRNRTGGGKEREDIVKAAFQHYCPCFQSKYLIYGYIGAGTYGTVYAVRERNPVDPQHIRHFAVKIQGTKSRTKRNTELMNLDSADPHLVVHQEAMALYFLRRNLRTVDIFECYQHGPFNYMVLEFYGVDTSAYDTWPEARRPTRTRPPTVHGIAGTALFGYGPKRTHLTPIQANKVMSQLIEGLVGLSDVFMIHQDLSHRNYLVDQQLNAKLIDFDQSGIFLDEWEYLNYYCFWLHALEHVICPEMVAAFHLGTAENAGENQYNTQHGHDSRKIMLWKLACLSFELLHGYAPWEDVQKLHVNINSFSSREAHVVQDRRTRLMRQPVAVAEEDSQDAADFFQANLRKLVEDRPYTEELSSFPWVNLYKSQERDRTRAFTTDTFDLPYAARPSPFQPPQESATSGEDSSFHDTENNSDLDSNRPEHGSNSGSPDYRPAPMAQMVPMAQVDGAGSGPGVGPQARTGVQTFMRERRQRVRSYRAMTEAFEARNVPVNPRNGRKRFHQY